ncbi:hypothetical protein [Bacillus sp. FJAT-18017]|uniref:hypothetical protein n=1 Tax=Bacillus sp. FJAT-18017 TaxID=1705566 RepID=UPI0018D1E21F|nr:hypothetical protein [Bacillus sp. FJAT-18017]
MDQEKRGNFLRGKKDAKTGALKLLPQVKRYNSLTIESIIPFCRFYYSVGCFSLTSKSKRLL